VKTKNTKILSISIISILALAGCAPNDALEGEQVNQDPAEQAISDEEFINDFSDLPPISEVSPGDNITMTDQEPWEQLEDYYNQEIDWFDCTEDIQCGYVWTPTDYNDLDLGMTYIAIVRQPATGDDPQGSLLVNPGGPGASGVDLVFNAGNFITTEDVREDYDLIGFDPRGVRYSDSVYCGPGEVEDAVLLDPGKQHPLGSKKDLLDTRQEGAYFAQACFQGTGSELLSNIDSASAAKDMDIIRAAVNDDKLNFLGFSYGSQLGSVYAALFPDKIGRMVLDGAINPTLSAEESSIRQAGGFELAFNNYIDNCLEVSDCPVEGSTRDAVKTNITGLLSEIEETPLPTELDNELAIWPAIIGIINSLYSQPSWQNLTTALRSADEGDGTGLLESAYQYLERSSEGEYFTNIGPANVAINCLDESYSEDPATIAETNKAIEEAAPFFARYFNNPYVGCAEWPYESNTVLTELDYQAELSQAVLVIGTTGDPATPFRNAEDLSELLNPGILLTHEGEGHTVYANNNACVDEIVDGYLLTGEVPSGELVCSD
jgi:pimeloyl-ACP methyl ester carboxylesterase